jgi:hypothetical protein
MTSPCENTKRFDTIENGQNSLKDGQRDLRTDVDILKNMMTQHRTEQALWMKESQEVVVMLRDMAIEGRENQNYTKKTVDVLFQKDRERRLDIKEVNDKVVQNAAAARVLIMECAEKKIVPLTDRVKNLEEFKTGQDAKNILVKDLRVTIPVLCTIFVTLITAWDRLKTIINP